jgi:hypothetical protein
VVISGHFSCSKLWPASDKQIDGGFKRVFHIGGGAGDLGATHGHVSSTLSGNRPTRETALAAGKNFYTFILLQSWPGCRH